MSIIFNPKNPGGGGGFNPPSKGGSSGGNTKSSTNPALLTSTGGLIGSAGLLMTPVTIQGGASFILVHDPSNFNTEEDTEYDYPEIIPPLQYQDGRIATYSLMYYRYRELGAVTFNFVISYYDPTNDQFVIRTYPRKISNLQNRVTFPDGKLHTVKFGLGSPIISGERPQIKITRKADKGPLSITKVIICGDADETPQF